MPASSPLPRRRDGRGAGAAAGWSPWLVAVDMQEVFADPASPWGVTGYREASAGIRVLLPMFRGRTVFARFVAPRMPEGAWTDFYEEWPFALQTAAHPMWAVTQEFDTAGSPVIDRTGFGAWGTALAEATEGAPELILTGVGTDTSIMATALAAADAGVHVRVVADACTATDPADHRRALDAMALFAPLIHITVLDEVLESARPLAASRRI